MVRVAPIGYFVVSHAIRNVLNDVSDFVFLPISAATEAVQFQNTTGVAKNMGAPLELVASDVLDHYRTYALLERLLYTPNNLSEQPSFQLDAESQQLLIDKYDS